MINYVLTNTARWVLFGASAFPLLLLLSSLISTDPERSTVMGLWRDLVYCVVFSLRSLLAAVDPWPWER